MQTKKNEPVANYDGPLDMDKPVPGANPQRSLNGLIQFITERHGGWVGGRFGELLIETINCRREKLAAGEEVEALDPGYLFSQAQEEYRQAHPTKRSPFQMSACA